MTNHAHILLRSGTHGLSRFMRRFLTGHAIAYNRRHKRQVIPPEADLRARSYKTGH